MCLMAFQPVLPEEEHLPYLVVATNDAFDKCFRLAGGVETEVTLLHHILARCVGES